MNRTNKTADAPQRNTPEKDVPESRTAEKRAKFSRLILRHKDDLTRFARHLCRGNEDRAQDFVQDTLLCAYRAYAAGGYRECATPRPWLMRILTNLYINDFHRRRRWEAESGLNSPAAAKKMMEASHQAARAEAPAARLMAATLDEAVERALATLPEKLRHCVILVDLEGLDYEQAAQTLHIPIGTVRSRLSRSRGLLKPLLQGYAEERCRSLASTKRL